MILVYQVVLLFFSLIALVRMFNVKDRLKNRVYYFVVFVVLLALSSLIGGGVVPI